MTSAARSEMRAGVMLFFLRYIHLDLPPRVVWIERRRVRGDLARVLAKVFFVYDAIVADQERGDAGVSVFGGPGDQREPADHLAVHDEVVRAAGRLRALTRQNLIVIAVESFTAADAIAAPARIGDRFA